MAIPKIIHQIWIGPNKRPDIWMDTFKKDYISMYPDYEYVLWNESNIPELFVDFSGYNSIYNVEQSYNGKSDILRYLILYKYGGIYVDADSVWVNNKNFDDLLVQVNESGVFVSYEPNTTNMCGGVMGSTKNNYHMRNLIGGIENYATKLIAYTRKINYLGVSKVIGPKYLNNYLKDKNVSIFPSIYFYPITWHGVQSINEHTKIKLPEESYTFQYGYTTNSFYKDI